MQSTRTKSLPIGLAVAAVVAVVLFDSAAMAAESGRERRTRGASAPAPAATAPAPAPAAGTPGETICYSTVTLPPAPAYVESPPPSSGGQTSSDGRVRRTRDRSAPAPVAAAPEPIVVKTIVPCETAGTGPQTPPAPVGSQTPGLLEDVNTTPGNAGHLVPPPELPISIAQVPEPSVLALLGVGAAGFAAVRLRRRSAKG